MDGIQHGRLIVDPQCIQYVTMTNVTAGLMVAALLDVPNL
jgi:hypothetical protein